MAVTGKACVRRRVPGLSPGAVPSTTPAGSLKGARARRDPSPRSGSGSGGPRRPVRSGEPLGLPLGAEPPVTFPGSRAAAAPARRAWSPAPAHAAASTWLHHCVLVARLRQSAASPAPRVSGFRTWEGAHARGDARRVTEARNPAPCPRPPPPEVHALGGNSGASAVSVLLLRSGA